MPCHRYIMQKGAISAVFKHPLVVIYCHNSNLHSSNMTALNKLYVALSTLEVVSRGADIHLGNI